MVGFSVSFTAPIQAMLAMRDDGRLGEIISIWSRRLCYMDPSRAAGWRKDHDQSGGLLFEINIHELEWMMRLGGDVSSVYARMAAPPERGQRGNDHLWIMLGFASGATGTHEGSWHTAVPCYYRGVHGTAGGATTGEWGNDLYYAPIGSDRSPVDLPGDYDKRANFLDAIEHGTPSVADADWGLKVMTVADAVFRSAGTGQAVTL